MTSPFPGMDPYLERFWNDVQGPLTICIADALNDCLPQRFRATIRERDIIADQDQPLSAARYPDVAALEAPRFASGGTAVESSHLLIRSPEW